MGSLTFFSALFFFLIFLRTYIIFSSKNWGSLFLHKIHFYLYLGKSSKIGFFVVFHFCHSTSLRTARMENCCKTWLCIPSSITGKIPVLELLLPKLMTDQIHNSWKYNFSQLSYHSGKLIRLGLAWLKTPKVLQMIRNISRR